MASRISVAVIGTFDTKLQEHLYLRSQILSHDSSVNVILIDAGRTATDHEAITIKQPDVLKASGYGRDDAALKSLTRGEIVKTMIDGAIPVVRQLHDRGEFHAIIGLGGSSGTSIAAAVMRQLPLTFPKLIVSTVASGDTKFYVAETDITMMYSVVDVAGLNQVLKAVVDNAAAAIVGMAKAYVARLDRGLPGDEKKVIGITMFGVTTKGADAARMWLERNGFEVCVFHATGAGGRAMERLVKEGHLRGVLDLTTTELADELVGGVFPAGSDRLTVAAKASVPQIVSVGALDMVNFGAMDTVPAQFRKRNLVEHNPSVTIMRTTSKECEGLGNVIAKRLRENITEPRLTEVWLPLRGVSMMDVEGQAFYDEAADDALFAAIRNGLKYTGIKVVEFDSDINDAEWAESMARRLAELIQLQSD
ncbi:hypothetical protein F4821DRAFT_163318 [Hypoxylon rubiginosum]|uniref:Uncharacterized protein n=1 Tax=Hypoxylon rubiginosum TaxID=110542 RepID=A0ACC0CWK3_9PEZI|nr:hypothetical protein F4821DRAFT_163318 [Hypoxylon rubiginosum]